MIDGATAEKLGIAQWAYPRAEIYERATEITKRIAALPAAALTAAKFCITSADQPGRGGYIGELEPTRDLQTDGETRARVSSLLNGKRP